MEKNKKWFNNYWWIILIISLLSYIIVVGIVDNIYLSQITKNILEYTNLLVTPLGVILGLILGYPLLKKKVVEGYVTKQFDIMDNANREVRKLCIQLSEKYPISGDSTRLGTQYINEMISDIENLYRISIDANRDTFRYVNLLYKSICKFQSYKTTWSYDEIKDEVNEMHKGYYAIYYQERLSRFFNKHLQEAYTLSTSIGFMPSSEINTKTILTKKLNNIVRDNKIHQVEGLHWSLSYHHSSALLVLFYGNNISTLGEDCGLLMQCCYESAPTPSALARILYLNGKYIPLLLEGEPFLGMPMFTPELKLIGYTRKYSIQMGSDIKTHYYICHYANISSMGFVSGFSEKTGFFNGYKDTYLNVNTFNVDDTEIVYFDKERIIVKIPELKVMEYYKKVEKDLLKKLNSENK